MKNYVAVQKLIKHMKTSYMTKKRVKNNGIVPQYYVEDDHEPIIPKELFYKVQEEIMRRSSMSKAVQTRKKNQKVKYSSLYAMTGLVLCGKCGHEYRRVTWARNGKKKIVWRCTNRLNNGVKSCNESPTIEESILQEAVMRAIQKIASGNGDFVGAFRQNVIRVIGSYGNTKEDEVFEERIKAKQQEMITLIAENAQSGSYTEEFDRRYQAISEEINKIKEQQLEAKRNRTLAENYEQRVKEMDAFLQDAPQSIPEFDDALVRRLIENIRVVSAEKIMIQFKSGIVMEQKLKEEW